ncbi:MAG TPA: monofunctional biosynthetic peptidoglycan transglycosylase [Bryobacteraceae bacterium]|nr:monofunctional biosynthetic peptidoglycan transglycosylase [Bryobacteraceae bacterium]
MPGRASNKRSRVYSRSALSQRPRRGLISGILIGVVLFALGLYCLCAASVFALRWINPPVTMVQVQRRVEAMRQHRRYEKRYRFVPLRRISPNLQHAVIAAEDGRFFQHHGFDWVEMQKVLEDDMKRQRLGRGGSTITQQLVKNLFLTTERSLIRKGLEAALVPLVEALLPKNRILELYLNVIEWGPGVYGAEAASEFYYHVHASEVSREQAARLAAIIPAPLKRRPGRMDEYSAIILDRMAKTGW